MLIGCPLIAGGSIPPSPSHVEAAGHQSFSYPATLCASLLQSLGMIMFVCYAIQSKLLGKQLKIRVFSAEMQRRVEHLVFYRLDWKQCEDEHMQPYMHQSLECDMFVVCFPKLYFSLLCVKTV